MTITYIPPFLPVEYAVARSGHNWKQIVLAPITTTDATPVTVFSAALANGQSQYMRIFGSAVQSDGSNQFVFESANGFRRSTGGTSARAGTATGVIETVANSFAAPRPAVTWADPSVSNVGEIQITGKASTTITWYLTVIYSSS